MPLLNRAAILTAPDLMIGAKEVPCPEWGGNVLVRVMSLTDRVAFEKALKDQTADVVALAVVGSVCDESGQLLFTLEDLDALRAKSPKPQARIFDVFMEVNRFRPDDLEDAVKN